MTYNPEPRPAKRALVIVAHPDDIEFVLAGTIAKWVKAGSRVRYVLVTSGDAGTHRTDITREELARIREAEQQAAADVLGVEQVIFLRYPDGMVTPSLELRRDLVREIRAFKPDTVFCYDPTRFFSGGSYVNHPDHRAVATAALDAIAPTAAMPLVFPELGLEPHRVRQILLAATPTPDTWIDISETFDLKVEALRQHQSQLNGRRRDFMGMIKQWAIDTGMAAGLQYAEAFMKIVRPDVEPDTV